MAGRLMGFLLKVKASSPAKFPTNPEIDSSTAKNHSKITVNSAVMVTKRNFAAILLRFYCIK